MPRPAAIFVRWFGLAAALAAMAGLIGFPWVCLGRQAGGSAGSSLETTPNPYSVIVDKNAFRLRSLPPPPGPENPPPPAIPLIHLSGFTQTGGEVKVLLAVELPSHDPKHGPETHYLALTAGDKGTVGTEGNQAVVELVKADPELEKVDLLDCGTPVTLTMKSDGYEKLADAALAMERERVAQQAQIAQLAAARAVIPPHLVQETNGTHRLMFR